MGGPEHDREPDDPGRERDTEVRSEADTLRDALATSERRFRALHDGSPEGFVLLRAERDASGAVERFRCTYANGAARTLLAARSSGARSGHGAERGRGRSPGDPVGADLRALWPALEHTVVWKLLLAAAEDVSERSASDASSEGPSADPSAPPSVEVASASGGSGWYRCTIVRLDADELALRFDDITARRRGEQALAIVGEATHALGSSLVREEMLAAFARATATHMGGVCGVHLRDATGRVRCIAAAEAGSDRPITRSLADLFRDDEQVRRGLGWVLRSGGTEVVDEVTPELLREVARDDRALATLEALGARAWMFVPIVVRDEIAGALTLEALRLGRPYDLADRVIVEELARRASASLENVLLYEEAQRANALKDEFLSIASHELRTPLSTILGWSKLLSDDPEPSMERVRKGLAVIHRNAQAQARLVDDILDTSRILRNKIVLDRRPIAVAAPMAEAVDRIREGASQREIELVLELDEAAIAPADANRLRQIFFHLLSNAVKFTPERGRVTARVAADRASGTVVASVCDNGAGLDPAFLPHLFERFRLADASSTRKHGGLGLGLALAKKLVDLHGGTISVESEGLGRGACFTVRLPDQLRASEPGAATSPGISIAPRPRTPEVVGVRVLLVDDHDDARELYGSVLSLRGALVTLASSAAEARALLRGGRYDVLVSDIAMPHEDGRSLVRFAREHDPVMRCVAISAYTQPEDVQRALDAGFERYLFKPVDSHELASAIAELADTRTSAS